MISTHVLDIARGVPASGVAVMLEARDGAGWRTIGRRTTDDHGRIGSFADAPLATGTYRLTFDTGAYHQRHDIAAVLPECRGDVRRARRRAPSRAAAAQPVRLFDVPRDVNGRPEGLHHRNHADLESIRQVERAAAQGPPRGRASRNRRPHDERRAGRRVRAGVRRRRQHVLPDDRRDEEHGLCVRPAGSDRSRRSVRVPPCRPLRGEARRHARAHRGRRASVDAAAGGRAAASSRVRAGGRRRMDLRRHAERGQDVRRSPACAASSC